MMYHAANLAFGRYRPVRRRSKVLHQTDTPLAHIDYQFGESANLAIAGVENPAHPSSIMLLEYWRECRKDNGAMTLGRDIPARRVGALLRDLLVLEPVDGGNDYVFRLVGSGLLKRYGRDVRGRRFSQLYTGSALAKCVDGMNECLRMDKPVVFDVRLLTGNITLRHHESLDLPIKARDGNRELVLSGTFYFE